MKLVLMLCLKHELFDVFSENVILSFQIFCMNVDDLNIQKHFLLVLIGKVGQNKTRIDSSVFFR